MRSSNPALQQNTFSNFGLVASSETMTSHGVVLKTAICLLCLMLSAGWTWMKFFQSGGNAAVVTPWMWVGMIGGFVVALATIFKKEWAPMTAPLYSVFQGLFIGAISSMFESAYPGIVIQAVGLTFGTLFMMLFLYSTGIIKVTEQLKMGIFAATGAIALFYLVALVLSLFHVSVPLIYSNTLFGIGFSLFVVVIAALNLVLDFDFIDQGTRMRAPKYMEWYASFALMVTLVWLYIEFLRLLSKIQSRN